MMPFGDCTVHSQLHYPLDESNKEDLMLFTGLLIGCGKNSNFAIFSESSKRKKWLISEEICGNFQGKK